MSGLEDIVIWIQILGVPVAIIGIWVSVRNASRSQDIQVILSVVDSFRDKWESGWADLLDSVETRGIENLSKKERQTLRYMLNWIDWVGRLSSQHVLRNEKIILGSLSHSLMRAIKLSDPIIREDIAAHGDSYWAGLHFVRARLEKL